MSIQVPTNSSSTTTATSIQVGQDLVPIVKNLILIGWAAGESFLDVKDINSGKDVPI